MAENLVLGVWLVLPFVGGGLLMVFARRIRRTASSNARDRRPARLAGRPGARVGWPQLVLGNLLVLLFFLCFVPLAGEIWFRFCCDNTDSLEYTKVCKRWFKRHWRENTTGFRDNVDYFNAIEPGKRRVTFVGDSFTAGHGVKEVEDRFVNRLRKAHPGMGGPDAGGAGPGHGGRTEDVG